jgi:hypothetical protein
MEDEQTQQSIPADVESANTNDGESPAAEQATPSKNEALCDAITDEKMRPPSLLTKVNDFIADKLPGPLSRIAKDLPNGPMNFGYGEEGKQKCLDHMNGSTMDRIKTAGRDLKRYAFGD